MGNLHGEVGCSAGVCCGSLALRMHVELGNLAVSSKDGCMLLGG